MRHKRGGLFARHVDFSPNGVLGWLWILEVILCCTAGDSTRTVMWLVTQPPHEHVPSRLACPSDTTGYVFPGFNTEAMCLSSHAHICRIRISRLNEMSGRCRCRH